MTTSSDAPTRTVLFFGDSITDAGRRDDPQGLGHGYVRVIAEHFEDVSPGTAVINRGISGNRTGDLIARLEDDVLGEAPDVVSILIGINDVWRRYDRDEATSAEQFEENLRTILTTIRDRTQAQLVIVEPFLLPVADKLHYREDLDPKIAVLRRLAAEFDAVFVDLDAPLTASATQSTPETVAPDGVHPSADGHRFIADAWLKAFGA
ncbi:SGNH/GDSL hydrolase family protein [Microbacterium sp. NPDC055903]